MVEDAKLDYFLRRTREDLAEPFVLVSDHAVWKGNEKSSEEYLSCDWVLLFVSDSLVSALWNGGFPSAVRKSVYANGYLIKRSCAEAVLASVCRMARSLVVFQRVKITADAPSRRCRMAECFICESALPHADHGIHAKVRQPFVATAEHEGRGYVCRIYRNEGNGMRTATCGTAIHR